MARLVTGLGTAEYRQVRWRLGDCEPVPTRFAPVATARLAGEVEEVVVLVTDQAVANWEALRGELGSLGIAARDVRIPAGRSETELWEVFAAAERALEGASEVVLDVTHSFRHLAFVLFATLGYFTSLLGLGVRGVYYGAMEAGREGEAPLWNLGPLLDLTEWSHAARAFRETGGTRWLGHVFREAKKRAAPALGAAGKDDTGLRTWLAEIGRLESALDRLGWTLGAGLPIESALEANGALMALAGLEAAERAVATPAGSAGRVTGLAPVTRTVFPVLRERLRRVAIDSAVMREKAGVPLDRVSVMRDLRIARLYLEWRAYDRALLVLREWLIDRCLLARGTPVPWLDYAGARSPMERALNAAAERARLVKPKLTSAAAEGFESVAALWQAVSVRRNAIAHAGKRPERVAPEGEVVTRLLEACEARSGDDVFWRVDRPGAAGVLLLTALGLSPGVLFTALRSLEADAVLVIASEESVGAAWEAWEKARQVSERGGRLPPPAPVVLDPPLKDPHQCFWELGRALDWARPRLLGAGEVIANVTGGTSGMQYLVERVAGHAARLGVPVRRCALVDRRAPHIQRDAPWVVGELVFLAGDDERAID